MRVIVFSAVLTVFGFFHAGSRAVAGCEDPVIYKVTASAYPEANQSVVAQMRSQKDCSLSNASIQNADDPEDYSWEAYRFKHDMKTGQSQSEYIGRAFLFDRNHLIIRLNQDMKSYASDARFFPFDMEDRMILLFVAKGMKNFLRPDFDRMLGKSNESSEELAKKIKFIGVPVETGIRRFNL